MSRTPTFTDPPIERLALGLRFVPADPSQSPPHDGHLGGFWQTHLRAAYPRVLPAPPTAWNPDDFGQADRRLRSFIGGLEFHAGASANRLQCFNAPHGHGTDRVVELQENALWLQWRRVAGVEYPSFARLCGDFVGLWQAWIDFLGDAGVVVAPDQWVVTYVDRLDRPRCWTRDQGWAHALPALLTPAHRLTADAGAVMELDSTLAAWEFRLPEHRAVLSVAFQEHPADVPERESATLEMTARGAVGDSPVADGTFTLGHRITTDAFLRWTSAEVRQAWGRGRA